MKDPYAELKRGLWSSSARL